MHQSSAWLDRADSLVARALDLPADERAAFLDGACDDADLRAEVDSLLHQSTRDVEALDRPLFELFEPARSAEPAQSAEPQRVGPYRLAEEIGVGATARVYRAVRADGSDPRPVAVKLLRRGLADEETVHRFRREGEVLSDLRHPAIARLRGGGVTDDGRPFLVMDLVEGATLDRWVAARRPSIAERLRLFVAVCAAVQLAHERLVVHGDLKPSNVLVTANAEPRLLDFGIAKLLDPSTLRPHTITATAAHRLTPAYASPEQLLHRPLGVGTDVYSLGVVLFELLAGRRPLEPESETNDWRRALLEDPAPRPSEVCDPAVARRLRGDLDAIVARALEKDPRERYRSVRELADDVERHLHDRPVLARGASRRLRAAKFARRHRGRLLAAALVVAMLAAFLVDREHQRRRLAIERDKAEQVSDFLLELFRSVSPSSPDAGEATVRELLERGDRRLERLGDRPALRASFLGVLGEAYDHLGDDGRAHELLSEALEVERLAGTPLSLGVAERRLGSVQRLRGELSASIESLERSIARLARADHERAGFEQAVAWNELGLSQLEHGASERASAAFDRSLALFVEHELDDDPEATSARNNLALLAHGAGRYDEAASRFESVLDEQRRHFGDAHPAVAAAYNNLAAARWALGDPSAARRLFERALEVQERAYGPDHEATLTSGLNLASAFAAEGDREGAEARLRAAKERLEAVADTAVGRRMLPVCLNNLTNLRRDRGDPTEAMELLRRALEIASEDLPAGHPQAARYRANLGRTLRALGRAAEARRALWAARKALDAALGAEHPDVVELSSEIDALDRVEAQTQMSPQ